MTALSLKATCEAGTDKTLAVILHGWGSKAAAMQDVANAVTEKLGATQALDIYMPRLAYGSLLASTRTVKIVASLVKAVDDVVEHHGPYAKIVLIGHSFGATIARRLFLAAHGPAGDFVAEPELTLQKRTWAAKVERIVLIAAFNRGWQISPRMSWRYAFWFNLAGFVGHLMPRHEWVPTIFDIRLGAPFIVQTRLNWLAYRLEQMKLAKQDNATAAPRPLLIQLLGTEDDLISPFDQVDIAVDGTTINKASPASRDYFLVQTEHTKHENAIDFTPSKTNPANYANARRKRFCDVLSFDRGQLDNIAVDPRLLVDEVDEIDDKVTNTVFVIHGIRDDGYWTHRIAEAVRQMAATASADAPYAFRAWTPTYGYLALLPFVLWWVRRQKTEWFMDQYTNVVAQYPESDLHYVGHSCGTYLAARALADYPACQFNHVLFAGSVVRKDYNWVARLNSKQVLKINNLVASADWIVALLPKSVDYLKVFDLGGAGFDGFSQNDTGIENCEYVVGSHGAGIVEDQWPNIARFIIDGTWIVPSPKNPLYTSKRDSWLVTLSRLRLGLPLAATIITGIGFVIWYCNTLPWALFGLVIYMIALRFFLFRF